MAASAAQEAGGADPLADVKRREVLDQTDPATTAEVERYAMIVRLPAALVLLGLLFLRSPHR